MYGFIPPTYVRDPPGYTTSPQVSCVHKNGIKRRYKNGGINGITLCVQHETGGLVRIVHTGGITLHHKLCLIFARREWAQKIALGLAYTPVLRP